MHLNSADGATAGFGQNGFNILTGETAIAGAGDFTEVVSWIAIKAVDGDAEVEAKSIQAGIHSENDHFTLDGTEPNSDQHITIAQGDVVYGDFSEIRVATGGYVQAFIAPKTI